MRVVAIRDSNETEVNIYGYGEYLGKLPCKELNGIDNPCIRLDSRRNSLGL